MTEFQDAMVETFNIIRAENGNDTHERSVPAMQSIGSMHPPPPSRTPEWWEPRLSQRQIASQNNSSLANSRLDDFPSLRNLPASLGMARTTIAERYRARERPTQTFVPRTDDLSSVRGGSAAIDDFFSTPYSAPTIYARGRRSSTPNSRPGPYYPEHEVGVSFIHQQLRNSMRAAGPIGANSPAISYEYSVDGSQSHTASNLIRDVVYYQRPPTQSLRTPSPPLIRPNRPEEYDRPFLAHYEDPTRRISDENQSSQAIQRPLTMHNPQPASDGSARTSNPERPTGTPSDSARPRADHLEDVRAHRAHLASY